MKNLIMEMLEKPFLNKGSDPIELTSTPDNEDIDKILDDIVPTGFYDDASNNIYSSEGSKKVKQTQIQNELIKTYRKIASGPEVAEAVNEIVDEAIFSPGSTDIINIDFKKDDIPQTVKDKFAEELKTITTKIRLDKNIYSMFSQYYIDGQLNLHCAYDAVDLGAGIKKVTILSPFNLIYNYTSNLWEYVEYAHSYQNNGITSNSKTYTKEELIRIDSGIYSDNTILSNLHTSIKTANMLSTLEDMLIPMRFTRSVSRRIFNIDVSNLNNKKAEEVMKKAQSKFKYKKFYDLNTGTISNQQHIASLTEDYWFPNRGGEKGTTVDTIDETGNLGELGDILYFKRKLYNSLKVPTNRINTEGPGEGVFDYDTQSIDREELKFFNFISRLRNGFLELFYELLRRQIVSKNIATDDEWNDLLPYMKIKFVSENKFFEKMERDHLSESINTYNEISELIGTYFSYSYVFKKVFKLSDDEITEIVEQIESEKSDPLYARFYKQKDEEDSW